VAGEDDIRKQFEAAIAGPELDDLRQLAPVMRAGYLPRPELRKSPRREPVRYRVIVDLNDAEPRIWRALELRSDMSLDLVHAVLQGAFDWTDSHLYRFSLGAGDSFAPQNQLYLCPFDVEDGEVEGIPVQEVRLDQTLQEPGDTLHYVYDYGDNWDLTLRLEAVLPLGPDALPARCVDGQRAAPPENCGGLRGAEALSLVLADPAHFDLDEVNRNLFDPLLLIHQAGVPDPLIKLLQTLRFTPVADRLIPLAMRLQEQDESPMSVAEFDAAIRPVLWFLERAQGEGFALTSAGYLKPEDVQAACEVVPRAKGWIGKKNRETQTAPVLFFREMLQSLGLLRKHKGRLVITKAGARGLVEHGFLWGHIASRLVPHKPRFAVEGSLVLLLCATTQAAQFPEGLFTDTIRALGWRRSDGQPLGYYDVVNQLLAGQVFRNLVLVGEPRGYRLKASAVGRALAREALLWQE